MKCSEEKDLRKPLNKTYILNFIKDVISGLYGGKLLLIIIHLK